MITVVLWGVLIGGVVYSHVVYFPVYLSDLPESSVLVTGKYALHEEVFWMSLHPALILSLIVTLVLNWKHRPRRTLILAAIFVYLGVIVATGIYFVPELLAFAKSAQSAVSKAEWLSRGRWWQSWSWLRGATLLVMYFVLLRSLVMPAGEVKDA
jgi:uncharacterized membrane protein